MCQWISSMLLSSWASSATTASKGVPDTQSREDKEVSREAAEKIADTFPICQPEGARVLGGFGRRELATCQGVRETSMMEGDFVCQGDGLPIEGAWRMATAGRGCATSFSRRRLGELAVWFEEPKTQEPQTEEVLQKPEEPKPQLTYEARQLLSNLLGSAEEAVTGSVGKGLLVVPGQWARLSNISADGKWIRTERFKIGAKEFLHAQGASVGRILEAYRKVRASHPELVAQLDIMSQPAANVDSVILSWCIDHKRLSTPAASGRGTASAQSFLRLPLKPWLWLSK